jgi:hypothetical protein
MIASHTGIRHGVPGSVNFPGSNTPIRNRAYAGPSDLAPAPRLTRALVEGSVQIQEAAWMGRQLMPDLFRTEWKMQIVVEDDSHLLVYNTERGELQVRARLKFTQATRDFEMTMFGLEAALDRRLYTRIADGAFRLPLGAAIRSRRGVALDIENRVALALSTPALWPAAHRADQSGAPWNLAGGNFKAAFELGVQQLLSVNNGYLRENLRPYMSHTAFQAAQADPTWLAWRANVSDNRVDAEAMASYLQLTGPIVVADANVSVDGVQQSLWGPSAFIVLQTGVPDINTEHGEKRFALLHRVTNPTVFAPYDEPQIGADVFTFEDWALPVVHDFTAGYFMHDMVG